MTLTLTALETRRERIEQLCSRLHDLGQHDGHHHCLYVRLRNRRALLLNEIKDAKHRLGLPLTQCVAMGYRAGSVEPMYLSEVMR